MMESRLAALETSSQQLLSGQREMRKDVACIVKTWGEFADLYIPYLKLATKREQDREKLRQAIIEKTIVAALWAAIVFASMAIWNQIQRSL